MEPVDHIDVVREVLRKPSQSQRLIQQRLRRLDDIPFVTEGLARSHIQLLPGDPKPEPVDPAFVRKANPGNVMLSAPYREGEVVYFNIFQETEEIVSDHKSDHFVGLPLLEGTRQIGMATSHVIEDIPLDTRMSLQDFSLFFLGYVEPGAPIVARAVSTLSFEQDLERDVTVFLDVRQHGRTCLAGTSSGRLFASEERYKTSRGKTRRLHDRYAGAFAESIRERRGSATVGAEPADG